LSLLLEVTCSIITIIVMSTLHGAFDKLSWKKYRTINDSHQIVKNQPASERDRLIQSKSDCDDEENLKAKSITYQQSFGKVISYNNVLLQGDIIFPKVLDELAEMEMRSSDILIASYPQSGSSVLEEIVTLLTKYANVKLMRSRNRDDSSGPQVTQMEIGHPRGHLRFLKGIKSPRILTTHLPVELIPAQARQGVGKVSNLNLNCPFLFFFCLIANLSNS